MTPSVKAMLTTDQQVSLFSKRELVLPVTMLGKIMIAIDQLDIILYLSNRQLFIPIFTLDSFNSSLFKVKNLLL